MASIGDITGFLKLDTTGLVAGVAIAKKSVTTIRSGLNTISTTAAKVEGSIFTLKNALLGLGAGAIVKDIIQTAVQFESLNNSLKASTGSAQAGAAAMAYVRSEAERLGLNLEVSATAFAKFSGAVKGTALEGQGARDVFTSIAEASSVLGLSADQTQGALTALEQMVSKGKVSAEELRGQLGERLPGAFQIAAKSMGMTTAELDKMMSEGKLISEDFLPKFAAELRNRFGKDVPDAAGSARAEFNRLGNSITELKLSIANSGLLAFITAAAKTITTLFKAVGKVMAENVSGQLKTSADRAKEMHETVAGMIPAVGKFVGIFADGLYAIKLGFLGSRMAVNAFGAAILQMANNGIKHIEDLINTFIDGLNSAKILINELTGADFDLTERVTLGPVALDAMNEFRDRAIAIQQETDAMLAAGLPSERIAEYTAQMQKAFETVQAMAPAAMPALTGGPAAPEAGGGETAAGSFLPDMSEEKLTGRLDRLREQFMSEEELLNNTLLNQALLIEENFAQKLISEQERNALLEQIEADHQNKLTALTDKGFVERQKFAAKSSLAQTKDVLGNVASLTQGMAQENKAMFQINKAAALANATISLYEGVSLTLSKYPYPLSIALAALQGVAGAAQIASIASSSFSGGGGGVSLGGGGAVPAAPTSGVSETISAATEAAAPTQEVTIDLGEEDQLISTSAMRGLIERIIETSGDMGVQLRLA